MEFNKVIIGGILGINRSKNYSNHAKIIGKVHYVNDASITVTFQDKGSSSDITIFDDDYIIQLPLTEELLDSTESFMKNDDSWASPNSSVIISKNPDSSNRKWNVKFLDEKRNVISIANFNYIDELQTYASLAETELGIKLGTVRILYQKYIENI